MDYAPTAAAIRDGLARALPAARPRPRRCSGSRSSRSSAAPRASCATRRLHDPLTGLPNRTSLYQRMRPRRPAACAPFGGLAGLLLIDLDRFKEVNDTLGHDQGDTLLREVVRPAERRAAPRRHAGAARRRRVRRAAARPARPRRRGRARAAAARRARAPFRSAGVAVQLERQRRRRAAPDHGTDVTHARPARRRRDVRGQARAGPRPRLRRRARPELPARLQRSSELRARARRAASSSCTTSRRSTSPTARSRASRRSCAGSTRATACSRRPSSSRSPSARA